MFAVLVVASMVLAGASDGSVRSSFTSCLTGAVAKGADAKVDASGFAAFARQACANEVGAFRGWVIAYDMKAGWTRKKSEPDADSQVADYLDEATDRFRDAQATKK